MSRETDYTYCLSPADRDGPGAVRSLIRLVGADTLFIATRSRGTAGPDAGDEEEDELLGRHLPADVVPDLFVAGWTLELIVGPCPLLSSLNSAVKRDIPGAVLGEYFVNHLFLGVGDHAVADVDLRGRPRRPATCFASLTINGCGTPADPGEFFRRLATLPEVASLERSLRERFGDVRVATTHSV